MQMCPTCARLYDAAARFCAMDGSLLVESDQGPTGDLVDGRYRIVRRLGRGGAGEVWLAKDTQLFDRLVAVKRLAVEGAALDEALARMEREAQNAALLDHPNLLSVSGLVRWESGRAIVLKYVPGPTLEQLVGWCGPLSTALVELIVQDVAEGLEAMHAQGIVHRDIKPANVIFQSQGRTHGRAIILDFGIARRFDDPSQSITNRRGLIGTLKFMPPEQVWARAVDHRADVYALAAMTCFLLLGGLPTRAPGIALDRQSLPGGRDWPAGLAQTIDAALSVDVERRTATPGEFARALTDAFSEAGMTGPLPTPAIAPAVDLAPAITVTVQHAVDDE